MPEASESASRASNRRSRPRGFWRALQPGLAPRWIMARAPRGRRELALTFDDGPAPQTTPRLLDLLAAAAVKVTFFFIGARAEQYPDLVRRAIAAGHCVANHGYDHRLRGGWRMFRQNLLNGEKALLSADPLACARIFRPPRGQFPLRLPPWALRHRRAIALWSVDSLDSFDNVPPIVETLKPETLRHGDIILLHEDNPRTLRDLTETISNLRSAGREFTTLNDYM